MNSLNKDKFELRCLSKEDVPITKDLMLNYFIPYLPLYDTFKVKRVDVKARVSNRVEETCDSGLSAGCFEKSSGKLVGALLCKIYDDTSGPLATNNPPELTAMIKFLTWLKRDLPQALNAKKISSQAIVAVDPEYARNGIYQALSEKCDQLAKSAGCDYVASQLVSIYTVKGSQKIGRKVLREVYYTDYRDPDTNEQPDMDFSSIHNFAQLVYNKL
uniref:Uncharacterized protein LOC100181498 n=1 Tax=Phallusia mammillata TaxID=59560 RepID=A0A6F9DI46_9ASCI|nr:uncharacterized protein LOC100181498 [Phallusia mammillata]